MTMKVVNPSFNKLMIGMGLIVVLLLVAIAWMAGSLIAKKSAQLEEGEAVAQQNSAMQQSEQMGGSATDHEMAGMTASSVAEQAEPTEVASSASAAQSDEASSASQTMERSSEADQQQSASSEASETASQTESQMSQTEEEHAGQQMQQTAGASAETGAQNASASTQQRPAQTGETAENAGTQQQGSAQSAAAATGGLAQKIAAELADLKKQSAQSAAQSGAKKEVYVYMKGKLVRVEDIDLSKLKEEDLNYVEQIKKMEETDQKPQQSGTPKVSSAQVKQAQAAQDAKKKGLELNQVVVQDGAQQAGGLAAQLQQLAQRTAETAKPKREEDVQYVSSLNPLEKERENEVRYIRVRPGDSLWKIAERAYGSGFMYPKIFKANPQLKSPDMIHVGDLLRVPL